MKTTADQLITVWVIVLLVSISGLCSLIPAELLSGITYEQFKELTRYCVATVWIGVILSLVGLFKLPKAPRPY